MQISGYALREARRTLTLLKESLYEQFAKGLYQFVNEDEPFPDESPPEIFQQILSVEDKLAKVETAQVRYNLAVQVDVKGVGVMTLTEAIKRVGGAGRMEGLWRSLAKNDGISRYSYNDNPLQRDPSQQYAQRTVSVQDCISRASSAGRVAGALRAAIAEGNSTIVELEDLTPDRLS